ncbi:hypothetical protein FJ251_05890 [bacterium]|nr:hypothetical protein [bacterium]
MGRFRKVCLWLHRELGFLAVGLTLVYAISGLALNHVHHWDANYSRTRVVERMAAPGTGETALIEPLVLAHLRGRDPELAVKSTWRSGENFLTVFLDGGSKIDVNLTTGEYQREAVAKRPWLFQMNFMGLNTGKRVWTGVADVYAGVVIVLAVTGIFLVRGRKGLIGRGGVLMLIGILLPVVYALVAAGN